MDENSLLSRQRDLQIEVVGEEFSDTSNNHNDELVQQYQPILNQGDEEREMVQHQPLPIEDVEEMDKVSALPASNQFMSMSSSGTVATGFTNKSARTVMSID